MTRTLAVFGFIFCLATSLMAGITQGSGEFDLQIAITHVAAQFIAALSMLLYCGFAALHSASRVQEPGDRVGWLIFTLALNIFGSLVYYLTKYQDFKSHGMGGLIRATGDRKHSFYRATPSELQSRPSDQSTSSSQP